MKNRLLLISLIVLCFSCIQTREPETHYVSFETAAELREYLQWYPERTPLIGAHRGGPADGFPENCIPTFERAIGFAPCLIECDVRKSRDDVLVLMHDERLERTTTGEGNITDFTLPQLKELRLVDSTGAVTEFGIPTLAEALLWAEGKAVLELDVKHPVTPEEIVHIINAHEAHGFSIVITYDWHAAETYHLLDKELVISCSARSTDGVEYLLQSSVPTENLIAFVGVSEPTEDVYRILHQNGIRTILGTMGNLDRKAQTRGAKVYCDLLRNGADVLATDDVELASEALALYAKEPRKQNSREADHEFEPTGTGP